MRRACAGREDCLMPNKGSDCCGTCWFNARNKGQAGYGHSGDSEPNLCIIRSLTIEDPFWTYCGNHPHRRPDRDLIPIGPVFVFNDADSRQSGCATPVASRAGRLPSLTVARYSGALPQRKGPAAEGDGDVKGFAAVWQRRAGSVSCPG